jgi:GNAT superfamily N-acetyltransferase
VLWDLVIPVEAGIHCFRHISGRFQHADAGDKEEPMANTEATHKNEAGDKGKAVFYTREATFEDNDELLALQSRCPQGTTIVVSTLNTPDFFARAKCYQDAKVFVVCDDRRIIASAACGLRDAVINGNVVLIGYEFQAFVDPAYRGKRIAGHLHQLRAEYLNKQGSVLSYGLILEGNTPSVRHVERQGFRRYRTLIMPGIVVFKKMKLPADVKIRSIAPTDYVSVAELLNSSWQDYDFYEPLTANMLEQLFTSSPVYSRDNTFVLEHDGKIAACLGFLDLNRVMKMTVLSLSLKMKVIALLLKTVGKFIKVPKGPSPGDILKYVYLSHLGFKQPGDIALLLKYINNYALDKGIQQIFFLSEDGDPLLTALNGFIHIDTSIHLYVKSMQGILELGNRRVIISGIDL